MHLAARLYDVPRPALIVAMVVGFIWFWPLGLATLAYLVGSGRIGGRCRDRAVGRWYNNDPPAGEAGRGWVGWSGWPARPGPARPQPSGNQAFDDYRTETLRRLEEEQKEFVEYLDRLRRAKDKAEFDQFMSDRRRPPATVPPEGQDPA